MTKPKRIQVLLFLLGLALLVFIIARSGIADNFGTLFTISIPLLVLAFILSNLNILFKIYRWKYLSEKYGQPISNADASIVTISSFYFANITPGKIGDLFKAYYMQKRYALGFFDGVSMIFYERFFELVILFLTASAVVFIELRGITVIILEASAIVIVLLTLFYYKADFFMSNPGRAGNAIDPGHCTRIFISGTRKLPGDRKAREPRQPGNRHRGSPAGVRLW